MSTHTTTTDSTSASTSSTCSVVGGNGEVAVVAAASSSVVLLFYHAAPPTAELRDGALGAVVASFHLRAEAEEGLQAARVVLSRELTSHAPARVHRTLIHDSFK